MRSNWKITICYLLIAVFMLTSCGAGSMSGSVNSTSTNAPMPTDTPSPTHTPTETLVPTPTMDADPLVYDNFNNPASDGEFNVDLWLSTPNKPSKIYQQDGVLTINNQGDSDGLEEIIMVKYNKKRLKEPTFIEADLLYVAESTSDGNVSLTIRDKEWDWQSQCVLNSTGEAFCWDSLFPQEEGHTYGTAIHPARKNQWHKFRIEIDPSTMTFTYYLDGEQIGQNTSIDAQKLQETTLIFTFAVWKPGSGFLNGQFDNVRVGVIGN